MGFAEKLTDLRKSRGWSQEELGERLGVTRQTVSKWELGATTPEMEKLAAMSELFGVSVDELIRGGSEFEQKTEPLGDLQNTGKKLRFANGEYKSAKTWRGMPLVHINLKGKAKGVVAVGLIAKGFVSVGLLSVGLLSVGVLALGLIAVGGALAAGGFASAAVAAGVVACGGVSVGVFSFGGASFGWFSVGGAAIGKYAFGGYASGDIAIGGTANGIIALGEKASGEITFNGVVSAEEFKAAISSRLPNTPKFVADILSWFAENISFDRR
ncbi:MAG: helix-turn-helix domain-containing protein [Oscillospiraceae bacterium]|nr:helix-turn-helix domain-containing protein [Oscillospiraceae bacterium]